MFDPTAKIDPSARLNRDQTAAALTARGFKIASATLAALVSRGNGPPFSKFGSCVTYEWGAALDWAKRRTNAPIARQSATLDAATNAGVAA
jgi:hypothetical protein